jgi:hypothetical protein
MTLAEDFVTQTQRERGVPVLETKRWSALAVSTRVTTCPEIG